MACDDSAIDLLAHSCRWLIDSILGILIEILTLLRMIFGTEQADDRTKPSFD